LFRGNDAQRARLIGDKVAVLRGIEGEKEKALIEVWDAQGLVNTIPTEDTHGPVCRTSLVTGLALCESSGRKGLSARLPTICADLQRQHIWLPVMVA
jgi:hypothetical protein